MMLTLVAAADLKTFCEVVPNLPFDQSQEVVKVLQIAGSLLPWKNTCSTSWENARAASHIKLNAQQSSDCSKELPHDLNEDQKINQPFETYGLSQNQAIAFAIVGWSLMVFITLKRIAHGNIGYYDYN